MGKRANNNSVPTPFDRFVGQDIWVRYNPSLLTYGGSGYMRILNSNIVTDNDGEPWAVIRYNEIHAESSWELRRMTDTELYEDMMAVHVDIIDLAHLGNVSIISEIPTQNLFRTTSSRWNRYLILQEDSPLERYVGKDLWVLVINIAVATKMYIKVIRKEGSTIDYCAIDAKYVDDAIYHRNVLSMAFIAEPALRGGVWDQKHAMLGIFNIVQPVEVFTTEEMYEIFNIAEDKA